MAGARTRRFQHPESEIVWAAIEVLDAADQHELLRELGLRFAEASRDPATPGDQVAAAVAALHKAAGALGHSPSVKQYRRLQSERRDLDLPSDTNIRRWLGQGNSDGWNGCLRRALLDAVSDGDFASPLLGRTYRFADAEIFAALRECADELGHAPTMDEYLQWAKRPDVVERPGRRPLSYHPFERFGGLRNALREAGVITACEARYAADGRLLPLRYAYTEVEKMDAIRTVAKRLGKSPSPTEYQAERQRIYKQALTRREIRPIPTAAVIRDHFGSWNAALEAAGLPAIEMHLPSFTGKQRPRYTEDQIIAWLQRAWEKAGEPFTGTAYANWREETLATTEAEIPSLACVARTFGGWKAACRRALPWRPGA